MTMVALELPLPLNLNNDKKHHMVVHRKRQAFYRLADVAIQNLRLKRKRWSHVTIRPRFYVWNEMDVDNATSRMKWAIDALRYAEVIPDDTPAIIRYDMDPETGGPYQVVTRKKGSQKLVLEITPDG